MPKRGKALRDNHSEDQLVAAPRPSPHIVMALEKMSGFTSGPPQIVDSWIDWDWFRPLHRKLWLTSGLACSLRAGRNDNAAARPSRAAGGSPRWRLARGRAPRHPLGRARRFDPVGLIAYSPHMEAAGPKLRIFVDADACPVKDEVYRIAARYGLTVFVVANSPIVVPRPPEIERVVVGAGTDAADDWIAERAGPGAIVVTSDVPLQADA